MAKRRKSGAQERTKHYVVSFSTTYNVTTNTAANPASGKTPVKRPVRISKDLETSTSTENSLLSYSDMLVLFVKQSYQVSAH